MKKRALVRELRKLGFAKAREGSSHEIWSGHGVSIPVGRHADVPERTAKGIIKKAQEAALEGEIE